jgi:hypothetical protein
MSESISAKISKMNPLPDAEVARRIYEKLKYGQQKEQNAPIEEVASVAEKEINRERNKEKAENKKKNKVMVREVAKKK